MVERARYLTLLATDGRLLLEAAAGDLDAPVPWCAGWTVRDAVAHTAEVYEHKIACIRLAGRPPDPWPPTWPDGRDPRAWFADAHERLLAVLADTDPSAPSWTWWPDDQTAGFWVRRMAQETAVHRVDVQGAIGTVTPVDAELAADGIDEVLTMMLAGDWSDAVQPGSTGTVAVTARDRTWRVTLLPGRITVEEIRRGGLDAGTAKPADAQLSGPASTVLLWLWGRGDDAGVDILGDLGTAARLRSRLAIATQ